MKEKNKGLLHILLIAAVIGVLTVVTMIGIGSQHKGSAKNIKLGLDLAGGVSITYESVEKNPSKEEMNDTTYRIQKRVENYSTEAVVYQEGSNRINVDIPGVTDANAILQELGKAGSIEFVDAEGKLVINGSDIETAQAGTHKGDFGNEYVVDLTLNASGTKKFAKGTKDNIGKQIAIVYDGQVISAPNVNEAISGGKAQISGQSTYAEAEKLASTIRIGALPLELTELRSTVVGAKLGAEAVDSSLLAGIIGFILVLMIMIIYYRIPGLASSIALVIYITLMLVILNGLDVTLTLPGIAGIILSIGMAVDANVIIFARIREELATGKTVRSSIKIGFEKALSAIIDGNVTTLIAAAVLWIKGSGTVKGFAQTLAIGIILSMFTALFVTKFILYALYNLGLSDIKMYGVQKERKTIDFIKHTKKFFAISGVVIAIGFVALIVNQSKTGEILNFGLDFKGGTSTEVTLDGAIDKELTSKVTALVTEVTADTNVEVSVAKDSNAILIKTKELTLDQRTTLNEKLVSELAVDKEKITTESISATVSKEMQSDAVVAVIIATICMLIYIWVRFKDITFGASAIIALVHDVLVVFMVYAVARISVGNTFIACMLTIVGYSINATIVVFDRIRENKAVMTRKQDIEEVINRSISQTISRNINTTLTTFVMVLALYIFGVDSVKDFALPLIVGILCGLYTSTCITGTLWNMFRKKATK